MIKKIEVVGLNECMYLGMTFESLGWQNKYKLRLIAKRNQRLTAIGKCLTRIPDMRRNAKTLLKLITQMCSDIQRPISVSNIRKGAL
jgi:hypothetical protein